MKIEFYPKNELVRNVIPPPRPVKFPDWFKDIPIYSNETRLVVEDGEANYSVKSCIPFMDTFSTGYVFNLWCDIQVRYTGNSPRITWANTEPGLAPLIFRNNNPSHVPVHDEFYPFTFSWSSHWGIETPKDYSCLFTHPLNRTDLPFITTSGVMDTDRFGLWGNQPFALKKGWEGIIPAGTPIIQFIPIKREVWKSEISKGTKKSEWGWYEGIRRGSKIRGYYKNNYWQKKRYE